MKRIVMIATVALILVAGVVSAEPAASNGAGVLALYSKVHESLAGDAATGVSDAAAKLATEARAAADGGNGAAWEALAAAAEKLNGDDLAALREDFHPVSKAIAKLVEAGALEGAEIYYCSMANGYWLQAKGDEAVRNPYYGSAMLKCGWKVDKVEG
jgi:hypothetical protein